MCVSEANKTTNNWCILSSRSSVPPMSHQSSSLINLVDPISMQKKRYSETIKHKYILYYLRVDCLQYIMPYVTIFRSR